MVLFVNMANSMSRTYRDSPKVVGTDSCLNAIMWCIAQRGKPITLISDNRTNFVVRWSRSRVQKIFCCMEPRKDWGAFSAKGNQMGVQSTQQLQESNVCSVGEPVNYWRYFTGTSKKVGTPIPQRMILSLVSSVFDSLGLFAPFSFHMRRLLKCIWTKKGH